MLRIPHCLDNRLSGVREVVWITRRPRSTTQKQFFFLLLVLISVKRLSKLQGLVRPEGLRKLRKLRHSSIENARYLYKNV
jgi:hypothetical protein